MTGYLLVVTDELNGYAGHVVQLLWHSKDNTMLLGAELHDLQCGFLLAEETVQGVKNAASKQRWGQSNCSRIPKFTIK